MRHFDEKSSEKCLFFTPRKVKNNESRQLS